VIQKVEYKEINHKGI